MYKKHVEHTDHLTRPEKKLHIKNTLKYQKQEILLQNIQGND